MPRIERRDFSLCVCVLSRDNDRRDRRFWQDNFVLVFLVANSISMNSVHWTFEILKCSTMSQQFACSEFVEWFCQKFWLIVKRSQLKLSNQPPISALPNKLAKHIIRTRARNFNRLSWTLTILTDTILPELCTEGSVLLIVLIGPLDRQSFRLSLACRALSLSLFN